ncbi:hypothetical protein AbraIFM66951_003322 [Aspergillus brasiliensis]|uniref:DUF7702 domain-containing protein n=1 Tax=Aspergillus brasiliensis TaxID=319629 RepID=A0A9W5YYV3_9EURO|nr:hypothetical protein AbraCBS73388_001091 [Aspergillus brasiliensis]GKZ50326.1 hypothetical protein AbraIFM66951_003322 [Aspergillus brasiliensis]
MNGIFAADLAAYLIVSPIVVYIFITHRRTGFLPWYCLTMFCSARVIGGALGVHDSASIAANIIQSVGITPLILCVDGLVHEARVYRYPYASRRLNWSVVIGTSITMVVAVSLSIKACLDIFEDKAQPDDYSLWKAGSALIVVVWIFQIGWSVYSLQFPEKGIRGPGYQGGTLLLQGALVALGFIGIRVIYSLVAVCNESKDLSPVYGLMSVRVILMFLPELFATVAMIAVGIRTRHLRELKDETDYTKLAVVQPTADGIAA